jgi:RES domain-containing protein
MTRAWCIVREDRGSAAFDGEGAWRFGGRWNSRGTRTVYTSATLSLAALETLVHLNPPVAFKYVAIPIDFDEALVETFATIDLPADWNEEPPPPSTAEIGDRWVKQSRSAVLELPSIIIPAEPNYLLNPAHSGFKRIRIGKPTPFSFDPRWI